MERNRFVKRMGLALREWGVSFLDPLDQRLGPLENSRRWRTLLPLGEVIAILFGIQTITGIFLSFYYHPSPEMAYESVKYLLTNVHFGAVMHSMHYWSAHAMLLVSFVYVIWGFLTANFKHPKELSWMITVVQMLMVVAFSFTGHLLPWDGGAYWTSVVGTEFLSKIPFIGNSLMHILRGGEEVGGPTLIRFFSLHILVFPWLFFYLSVFLLFQKRKEKLMV